MWIVAILLVVVAVAECAARIICLLRFHRFGTNIRVQGNARWMAHPEMIYANRPFYLESDARSQYNAYGMSVEPGDIRLPEKGRDDFWVICLGASMMAGMGSYQTGEWLKMTGIAEHPREDTIAGILEKNIQEAMPDKKVRVFTAAVAKFTLAQGRAYYEYAVKRLKADWVISIDGANEPYSLEAGESTEANVRKWWAAHPTNCFPVRQARFLMSRSALFFLIGETLFFKTSLISVLSKSKRYHVATRKDPEVIRYWLNQPDRDDGTAAEDPGIERAKDEFLRHVRAFHETLERDGQKHLLLVQPHLSLRNRRLLQREEEAIHRYYGTQNKRRIHRAFFSGVYEGVESGFDGVSQVAVMDLIHDLDEWVFLDACHVTAGVNRRVADEITEYILNGGARKPFQKPAEQPESR